LLAGDGPRSGPKPDASVHLTNPVRRFYCRFPADRQQAGLLRAAPESKALRPESKHCELNRLRRMSRRRFASAEGVGALLAGDGPRSGPKPHASVHLTNPVRRFYCRFPADRQQAGLLRAAPRIKSTAPGIKALRTKSIAADVAPPFRFCRRRRSLACRRWAAQRPQTRCLGTPDESGAQVLLPVPGRSSANGTPPGRTPTGCAQNQKHCAQNQSTADYIDCGVCRAAVPLLPKA